MMVDRAEYGIGDQRDRYVRLKPEFELAMPCPRCGGTVLCNGPNEWCSSCNWRNRYDV